MVFRFLRNDWCNEKGGADPASGDPQQGQLYMPPATDRYWKYVTQVIAKEYCKVHKIVHGYYSGDNLKYKNKDRSIEELIGSTLRGRRRKRCDTFLSH